MLNGWQTTGIVNLCSGGAFSPTSGRDNSFSGAPNNDTADQISAHAARPAGVGPLQQRFNTAAYTPNALGTFGTAGRNSLRGPAAWNVDFGLSKETRIVERMRAELRFWKSGSQPVEPEFPSGPERGRRARAPDSREIYVVKAQPNSTLEFSVR